MHLDLMSPIEPGFAVFINHSIANSTKHFVTVIVPGKLSTEIPSFKVDSIEGGSPSTL